MFNNNPKLSIIIPTFNSEKVLAAAINSVVSQSFTDFELLIIDGLSTDNTLAIARSYADSRIKIISEKDKGIYDAMNKGIERASGEWLYFLGSDDVLFDNEVLSKVFVTYQSQTSQADFVYANVIWGDTGLIYDGEFDILKLYSQNICHQCIFAKKQLFLSKGLFVLKYPTLADYYFNLLCFTDHKIKKVYYNIIIARFALNGSSGVVKDVFMEEKYSLFEQHIKKISFESLVKLRILYADKKGISDKIKFLINVVIYNILTNFFVRKLRKLLNNFKNR